MKRSTDPSLAAVIDPEMEVLAQRLVAQFHPERVILFGSQAAGRAGAESDVDLLLVMEHPGRSVEQAVAIRRFLD